MIIKVCGVKYADNYRALIDIGIEMIGINFYPSSPRYIGQQSLPPKGEEIRIGVYVGASLDVVHESVAAHDIDVLQLHGDEDVAYCRAAQAIRPIIKVWRVDEDFDFEQLRRYHFADAFLLDTMTTAYGGSGHKFDWTYLTRYNMDVPFLLSGGIDRRDASRIKQLQHPSLKGVDINSRFEDAPGLKNIECITLFKEELSK